MTSILCLLKKMRESALVITHKFGSCFARILIQFSLANRRCCQAFCVLLHGRRPKDMGNHQSLQGTLSLPNVV